MVEPAAARDRDRLVAPMVGAMRRIGERLSPGGTAGRILRSLDKAGNPARYEGIYSNGYPAPPRAGGGRGAGANPARN